MSYTNILSKSILMNIDMNWQNVQHMSNRERKKLINEVVSISRDNCSFVRYGAKLHLIHIIHHSECYFNKTGTSTKVKEFDKLGWYKPNGDLDILKILI